MVRSTIAEAGLLGGFGEDVEEVFEWWFAEQLLVHLRFLDQDREHLGCRFPKVPHRFKKNYEIFKSPHNKSKTTHEDYYDLPFHP